MATDYISSAGDGYRGCGGDRNNIISGSESSANQSAAEAINFIDDFRRRN